MEIDKLINKNELSRELGMKAGGIRKNAPHKKYERRINMLNKLIKFWREYEKTNL